MVLLNATFRRQGGSPRQVAGARRSLARFEWLADAAGRLRCWSRPEALAPTLELFLSDSGWFERGS